MKTLLTLFVLLFSSSVVAETWSCTYEWNNEMLQKTLVRKNDSFYDVYEFNGDVDISNSGDIIIKENSNFIHLYNNIDGFDTAYLTILDKSKKVFVMVGLEYNNSTDIIEGNCIIF